MSRRFGDVTGEPCGLCSRWVGRVEEGGCFCLFRGGLTPASRAEPETSSGLGLGSFSSAVGRVLCRREKSPEALRHRGFDVRPHL